jgi:hypothetical protein
MKGVRLRSSALRLRSLSVFWETFSARGKGLLNIHFRWKINRTEQHPKTIFLLLQWVIQSLADVVISKRVLVSRLYLGNRNLTLDSYAWIISHMRNSPYPFEKLSHVGLGGNKLSWGRVFSMTLTMCLWIHFLEKKSYSRRNFREIFSKPIANLGSYCWQCSNPVRFLMADVTGPRKYLYTPNESWRYLVGPLYLSGEIKQEAEQSSLCSASCRQIKVKSLVV